MSRFISQELKQIDFPNGDWVKVLSGISFEDFMMLMPSQELDPAGQKKEVAKNVIQLLKAVIKEWNFTDEKGVAVPCTPENIQNLNASSVIEISDLVVPLYKMEKKSVATSNQSSSAATGQSTPQM